MPPCQITCVNITKLQVFAHQIMPVNMPHSNQNKGSWHPRSMFGRYQVPISAGTRYQFRQVPGTNFGLTVASAVPQSLQVTLQQVAITCFLLMPSHFVSTQPKQHATLYGTNYTAQTARSTTPTSTTLTEQKTTSEPNNTESLCITRTLEQLYFT